MLQICHVFLGDRRLVVVFFVVEEHGEHVGDGLALRVSHGEGGGIDDFGHKLMLQPVASAVATDDAPDFPKAEVVEEFMTGDAYLAHEQLIDVVGGG